MKTIFSYFLLAIFLFASGTTNANLISANPSNYTSYLGSLTAGDTLYLTAGTYTSNLTINSRNGNVSQPIVIMGSPNLYTTVFQGNSCCNTVSITKCSYIVIKNIQLDGLNLDIDAVKAEGTTGNWAHHITLEYLNIINYGNDQQLVGISTKCDAWDWIIRKNKIIGAGTGMYLGNSNGDEPFVNGLIENNLIMNTVGYNIEIKHQLNGVRDGFPGTAVNGKTIIRYNVFCKESNGSTGGMERPNLLVGGFPLTGWGSIDYYEIYGNFFYQNPTEALFQGTGNIRLYDNIFVNHSDGNGLRAVYITSQNGVQPQDIQVFHNTVWTANSAGGIRLYSPNASYQQYCYANAVFSPSPITNFTNSLDNITDDYANATNYVLSATTSLNTLNLYPKSGQLTGTLTSSTLFQSNTWYNKDFNGDTYDWTYKGAYSGCCTNNGWQLKLDTMPTPGGTITAVPSYNDNNFQVIVYPNPFSSTIAVNAKDTKPFGIQIYNCIGEKVYESNNINSRIEIDFTDKPNGIYFLHLKNENISIVRKIIKQ
ncbi:MAG: T9SS type A sorting domain-containing protein [Bacteroidales bacterium]|nr:T9SS type A sorting domain-containing protein [Bacteroidales bacterium]